MALKLPDSAVPMGDFPVAKAVDIDFNDGENLQEKLDNGKLGGGGSFSEKQIKDWVKDGYAKVIKNNDTDAEDAMFIAYKNKDLFGMRIYKNDGSEHELKFDASSIYYTKNGVRVWGIRAANVPNTVIVSENTNVTLNSNCVYTVVNGVCYVSLWGFQCASAGRHVINNSMPKTRLTMQGSCTYGPNGYEGGRVFISRDDNKLYVEALATQQLYGSFSYPVAE